MVLGDLELGVRVQVLKQAAVASKVLVDALDDTLQHAARFARLQMTERLQVSWASSFRGKRRRETPRATRGSNASPKTYAGWL